MTRSIAAILALQHRQLRLRAAHLVGVAVMASQITLHLLDPLRTRQSPLPFPPDRRIIRVKLVRHVDLPPCARVVRIESVIPGQRQMHRRIAQTVRLSGLQRLLFLPRQPLPVLHKRQRRQQRRRLRILPQGRLHHRRRIVHLLLRQQHTNQPRRQLLIVRLLRNCCAVEVFGVRKFAAHHRYLCRSERMRLRNRTICGVAHKRSQRDNRNQNQGVSGRHAD